MDCTDQRWVIAELDARGEVDAHAAMCLGFAIEHACVAGGAQILVDLRELTAIGPAPLELFRRHDADCRASGSRLSLLLSPGPRQEPIVQAFTQAGLGGRIRFGSQSAAPPPPPSVRARRTTVRWSPRAATARR